MASVPELRKHDIVSSGSTQYLVLSIVGEGAFGKVAKCINLTTAESTALKIQDSFDGSAEAKMMQKLEPLDHEKANLVRCTENFMYQGMSCLAFEMLDQSLWDFMEWRPLSLNEIRPIAHQLLVTLRELKSVAIIHADLKPDNVMLVNHKDQPFRVKVIDFGLALSAFETEIGMEIQALGYRAPEVMLGLPISAAVDMWGLGCILAFLYLGTDLFPLSSPYHIMRAVCQLLSKPRDDTLNAGRYTDQFFTKEWYSTNPSWRMNTPEEHMDITGIEPERPEWHFHDAENLSEVVALYSKETGDAEVEDRLAFVDLLEQMLDPNADTRLKPGQALRHRFLTMDHLEKDTSSAYAESAFELMTVTLQDDLDDSSSEDVEAPFFQQDYPDTDCFCHEVDSWGSSSSLPNPDKRDLTPQLMQSENNNIFCMDSEEYDVFDSYEARHEVDSWGSNSSLPNPDKRDSTPQLMQSEKNNICFMDSQEYDVFDSYEACHEMDSWGPQPMYHVFDSYVTGEFSEVVSCVKPKTSEMIPIKIREESENYITEVKVFRKTRALYPEKTNLVRFIDNFKTQNMACIALEMLHMSLWEFVGCLECSESWGLPPRRNSNMCRKAGEDGRHIITTAQGDMHSLCLSCLCITSKIYFEALVRVSAL